MNIAIILASGTGSRMGTNLPKQFLTFQNRTILEHAIDKFEHHPQIDSIILVMHPDFLDDCRQILRKNEFKKIRAMVAGGAARSDSAFAGLRACPKETKNVLIHDAARPFVSAKTITNCLAALEKASAVCVAVPATDTIAIVNKQNEIESVPARSTVYHNQTPQGFHYQLIFDAHKRVQTEQIQVTDDVSIVLHYKLCNVLIVEGDKSNHKITYPSDIPISN
jgi:2-C-methyl-D-erythritol 4-phosphate cytidylyltransferase